MEPFRVVLKDAVSHGVLAGVSLPGTGGAVPDEVLELLHPAERAHALTLKGFRIEEFVGGRLAAQAAFRQLGWRGGPVLTQEGGAPVGPSDLSVSISHKRHMAVALVARREHGSLGVDLEDLLPERMVVADRVLREEELIEVKALPAHRQWTSVVVRFAIKEAIYKALAPRQGRYIGFEEAAVFPHPDGTAEVRMELTAGPRPEAIQARYIWAGRGIIATARASWAHPA